MFIFFSIYAILAVELFSEFGASGTYVAHVDLLTSGVSGPSEMSAMTDRGLPHGFEYYGSYSKAMYTLFQVMSGESWSEAVARPLLFGMYESPYTVAFFFVSFIILTQVNA